jgi:hypothetical protein
MTNGNDEPDKARSEFLIAMYRELMADINRHIIVVWQSVGVVFGAFASFALVEKNLLPLSVAVSLVLILCIWMLAHVYDASYWYNRNLVIIANIERQFLRQSDLKEIHYYFGKHRRAGAMITHLEIQKWLAVGVAALVLLVHAFEVDIPAVRAGQWLMPIDALPWLAAVVGVWAWHVSSRKALSRYETFLRNSPGKPVDASSIKDGPGHPT